MKEDTGCPCIPEIWLWVSRASLVAQTVKNLPAMQDIWVPSLGWWVWSLGWEDPLEEEMATHSSILAWRIPWTEEPGRIQFMASQRFGHDWAMNTFSDSGDFMSHVCILPISISLVLYVRRSWTGDHAPRVLVCCYMFQILTWIFSSHSLEQLGACLSFFCKMKEIEFGNFWYSLKR